MVMNCPPHPRCLIRWHDHHTAPPAPPACFAGVGGGGAGDTDCTNEKWALGECVGGWVRGEQGRDRHASVDVPVPQGQAQSVP